MNCWWDWLMVMKRIKQTFSICWGRRYSTKRSFWIAHIQIDFNSTECTIVQQYIAIGLFVTSASSIALNLMWCRLIHIHSWHCSTIYQRTLLGHHPNVSLQFLPLFLISSSWIMEKLFVISDFLYNLKLDRYHHNFQTTIKKYLCSDLNFGKCPPTSLWTTSSTFFDLQNSWSHLHVAAKFQSNSHRLRPQKFAKGAYFWRALQKIVTSVCKPFMRIRIEAITCNCRNSVLWLTRTNFSATLSMPWRHVNFHYFHCVLVSPFFPCIL